MAMTEEPISFAGPYKAFATSDGCRAEVRKDDSIVKKLSGETAWMDATREADDLNVAAAR